MSLQHDFCYFNEGPFFSVAASNHYIIDINARSFISTKQYFWGVVGMGTFDNEYLKIHTHKAERLNIDW